MNKKIVTLILLPLTLFLKAQLPQTDIYIYEVKKTKTAVLLHKGENFTKRFGYNNQPYFLSDSKNVIFVSEQDDKQTDVFNYEIKTKKTTQITHTKTSEYSPMISPDGKTISVEMVEPDSTQRLWLLNMDGTPLRSFAQKEDSIGYYCWLNSDSILFYKLSNPHSLHAYGLTQQKDVWLADNITRAFKPINKYSFFYVIKEKDKTTIRVYDSRLKKSIDYADAKIENEDFIWDKDFGLMKSDGTKIMRYNPEIKTWLEVADFSGHDVKKITRFAFSPNGKYLAIVNQKK